MILNRLVSWLSGIGLLIILELAVKNPKNIYWFVALSIILLFISVWQLTDHQITKAKFWNFFIAPFLFLCSVWLFIIFLEGRWLRQFIIFGSVILHWLFLKVVFLYLYHRPKYQAHTLGNISSYLSLITIFFLGAGFFSLEIFLGISFWSLTLVMFISAALLTYQLLWASQIPIPLSLPYLVMMALILTEIFVVVNFLPTSIYVNSLIVAVMYYLLSGLSRNWLLNIREKKVVVRYLTISLISLIIILASAKWI